MSTYQSYQKQIAELQLKADEARLKELDEAKVKIRAIMNEYGISIVDLVGARIKLPKASRGPIEIKYRNESTGETWTGRGRAPKWINGKSRDQFLVIKK